MKLRIETDSLDEIQYWCSLSKKMYIARRELMDELEKLNKLVDNERLKEIAYELQKLIEYSW